MYLDVVKLRSHLLASLFLFEIEKSPGHTYVLVGVIKKTTTAGFEPARAKHNGLAIHRLNHSATLSLVLLGRERKRVDINYLQVP